MRIKKTYVFAFTTSLIFSLFVSGGFLSLLYFKYNIVDIETGVEVCLATFILFFILLQLQVKSFIYNRVRKIYEDISLLDVNNLDKNLMTTDIDAISKEVQKFAEDKQLEIESLNERENYRREFLGNVSHELKTPLFTVQGYLLTLIEGAAEDKAIRDRYLERANIGVERLTSIVKDLDMISKLETNDLNIKIEPFNILEVVQNVFDLFEMKVKKKNMTLRFDKLYEFPEFVMGDPAKIEQVLINLIVNSIKYGKLGGTIMVSIESLEKNKVTIKVTDNGEGIKKENIGRIFERFYRVDKSRSRDQGGSGLGLAIVKHIIEAHKQTISLESEYGKGSVFSFTLKRAS
ncbi:sensor histidine kinase [Flavicella sediminum]|uniref:sensor histidine kinase n=1 Tax=Flavicella sediminum TaxID=2585141 RepID=UPI001120E2DF|nr:ATP-binding protein [Flavicella sediminum]